MILLTILVHLSLLSPVVSFHRYSRGGTCDVNQHYDDDGICEKHFQCDKPTATSNLMSFLSCEQDYVLQHSTNFDGVEGNWNTVLVSECDQGEIKVTDGVTTRGKATWLRCVRERGCDIDKYPTVSCGDNEVCEKPELKGNKLECREGFQLEGIFPWSNYGWKDILSITCTANKISDIKVEDQPTDVGIVQELRCVRLNVDSFFSARVHECKDKYERATLSCEMPISWSPAVTCKPGFILETTTMENTGGEKIVHGWTELTQASFKINKFIGNRADLKKLDRLPRWIRCARKKCSTCDHPCPTCVSTYMKFNSVRKWDECALFTCGPHSRTVLNKWNSIETEDTLTCGYKDEGNGNSHWKRKTNQEDAKTSGASLCEIRCTEITPLTKVNQCTPNDDFCDPDKLKNLVISDDKPMKCPIIVHKSKLTKEETEGTQIDCDKTRGVWKMREIGGSDIKLDEGTVSCRYKCNFLDLCPLCVKDISIRGRFQCPPDTLNIEIRNKPTEPWLPLNSAFFVCKKGRYHNEAGKMLGYYAHVKCILPTVESSTINDKNGSPAPQQGGFGTASCILIVFAILVIILIITCVVFKLRGKGWLHEILLAKLRDGKKKDKKKDKKKGKKSTTSKGKKGKSPGDSVKKSVSGKDQLNGDSPIGDSPGASSKAETGTPGGSDRTGGGTIRTTESNRKE